MSQPQSAVTDAIKWWLEPIQQLDYLAKQLGLDVEVANREIPDTVLRDTRNKLPIWTSLEQYFPSAQINDTIWLR
jgi:hypothetical protein